MENENEYIETDVRKVVVEHLKSLDIEHEMVEEGKSELEKQPYYSFYFSGTSRMVDSVGCIKVKRKNFDYIHLIRRG